jgi:hypothetical protein
MSRVDVPLPQPRTFLQTRRTDSWWANPTAILLGLLAFLIYGTWAAFQGTAYFYHGPAGQNYLSPFYSPLFYDTALIVENHATDPTKPLSRHAWFSGARPRWWPEFLFFAPALLVLWAPAGFRFTCYGFRGHYYKGFWGDPPNCAVGEPSFRGRKYRGERWLPLVLQNVHRYFMYLIIILLAVKFLDTWHSMWFVNWNTGEKSLGIAVGSLVLLVEPFLLAAYVGGCHSLRHLVGGRKDCMGSKTPRRAVYNCVGCLNRRHMFWGWASLLWIMGADIYVRLLAGGHLRDVVFFTLF